MQVRAWCCSAISPPRSTWCRRRDCACRLRPRLRQASLRSSASSRGDSARERTPRADIRRPFPPISGRILPTSPRSADPIDSLVSPTRSATPTLWPRKAPRGQKAFRVALTTCRGILRIRADRDLCGTPGAAPRDRRMPWVSIAGGAGRRDTNPYRHHGRHGQGRSTIFVPVPFRSTPLSAPHATGRPSFPPQGSAQPARDCT